MKHFLIALWGALAVAGCHGNGNSGSAAQTYNLSTTISGLSGDGLTLTVNGATLSVAKNVSTLELASGLMSGTLYSVAVATQPIEQSCSVAGGTGMVEFANVSNVVLTCSEAAFALGGTIIGLNGAGLVLANGTDTLSVAAAATSFTMPAKVAINSSYEVTVKTQPAGITCAVTQGSGTMPASASNNVTLVCSDHPFTVGGSISGLGSNSGLVLSNGTDILTVVAGAGSFVMPAHVPFGGDYAVHVTNSPAGLTCSAVNGSGTVGAANVTDVAITCSNRSFNVGGAITGLNAAGLVLANGSDALSVLSGASTFIMMSAVAYTGAYSISVQTNPTGETCTVSSGGGVMGAAAVNSVVVTCSPVTHTIGGTITGLGANSGLVLLNNGIDPTTISANATTFTMHTGVAAGSAYSITVGTQPYGITLSCVVTGGSGNANANVNTVAVSCSSVASVTSNLIAGYFSYPVGVAVDSHANVFVADASGDTIREFTFSNGAYTSKPINLLSGLSQPQGVSLDSAGNLYVADTVGHRVVKLDFSGGSYSTTQTVIATGMGYPTGIGIDASGNLFVSDALNHTVSELVFSSGSYGVPFDVGSGFNTPTGVAMDAGGNIFVADNSHGYIDEVISNSGTYNPTTVQIASGFNVPTGVALDPSGNLWVADTHNHLIKKVPFSAGTFGTTPITVGSGFQNPQGIAVDSAGNVFVADSQNGAVKRIVFDSGNYSVAPVQIGAVLRGPKGAVLDSHGNVFFADSGNSAVKEILANNGNYGGASVALGSGFNAPGGVAMDASGNLFVADTQNNAVKEINFSNGSYSTTPVSIGSGFNRPRGVAVDSSGNVYVADTNNNAIKKIVFSGGTYGASPVTIATGVNRPPTVAVDSSGNVFTVDAPSMGSQSVEEFTFSGGTYSAPPITLVSGIQQIPSITLDVIGNVYLIDQNNNSVKEIVYSNGSYAAPPVTVKAGFSSPKFVSLDAQGRVYVGDSLNLQVLTP